MRDRAKLVASQVLDAPARLGGVRLLAIDGPSGGGKSTFAGLAVEELRATGARTVLISTDDFATWDDPVGWWPRLAAGVLTPLAAGRPGGYRRMEWPDGVPRLGAEVAVSVPEVLVLEGVSAGRASVRRLVSTLCWVSTADRAARLARAVERDGPASRDPLRKWQEFESGWFDVDQTERFADTSLGVNPLDCSDQ